MRLWIVAAACFLIGYCIQWVFMSDFAAKLDELEELAKVNRDSFRMDSYVQHVELYVATIKQWRSGYKALIEHARSQLAGCTYVAYQHFISLFNLVHPVVILLLSLGLPEWFPVCCGSISLFAMGVWASAIPTLLKAAQINNKIFLIFEDVHALILTQMSPMSGTDDSYLSSIVETSQTLEAFEQHAKPVRLGLFIRGLDAVPISSAAIQVASFVMVLLLLLAIQCYRRNIQYNLLKMKTD